MSKRVVITGMGPVTAVGTGIEQFWDGIVTGRSGVKRVTANRIPEALLPSCKIAAELDDFDPGRYLDGKQQRRTDPFIQYAVAASQLASEDAKLGAEHPDPTRVGVVVGSAAGGFHTIEEQLENLKRRGPDRGCSPFTVPMLIVNMAAGWVSIMHNAKGPNTCSVTACATSTNSIGDAFLIIQRGDADVMFAGGSEAPITPLCMAAFASARTLSTRNDEPEKASRPFDKDRDGFVMGEGAAILILESLEHAIARGAKIYAEIVGYAMTGDAFDIVQPSNNGEGAARCMAAALKHAGLKPTDITYINAHGTSTPLGDKAETTAIKHVFGDYAKNGLTVSSTKSMTGHLLGAAGAIEAAACVLAIRDSILPPTINLDTPDPDCDLDYVPNQARKNVPIKYAMSNSFGFGGHNACLIFKRYDG